jgi:hypothetical protein
MSVANASQHLQVLESSKPGNKTRQEPYPLPPLMKYINCDSQEPGFERMAEKKTGERFRKKYAEALNIDELLTE